MPVTNFNEQELYGGNYRRGSDFTDGAERFKIADVELGEYQGNPTLELVLHDGTRASVRARNYKRLSEKWGKDPNAWIGKQVILDAGDDFNGKPALLIKPFTPKPKPAAPVDPYEDDPFNDEDEEAVPF